MGASTGEAEVWQSKQTKDVPFLLGRQDTFPIHMRFSAPQNTTFQKKSTHAFYDVF